MFSYDEKLLYKVEIDRPDMKYYVLLDRNLQGCRDGLQQAIVYIRQGFMIHNPTFHNTFMQLATRKINDMEILSDLLHKMHGVDNRYYDESNDDTPAFELIQPLKQKEEKKQEEQHHVNNDLTAAVLRNLEYENKAYEIYEQLIHIIDDKGANKTFMYLKESVLQAIEILKNMLEILTNHEEIKDFGEGDTHNAWDLDTSNYFDKPNPIFLNPSDLEDFPF